MLSTPTREVIDTAIDPNPAGFSQRRQPILESRKVEEDYVATKKCELPRHGVAAVAGADHCITLAHRAAPGLSTADSKRCAPV